MTLTHTRTQPAVARSTALPRWKVPAMFTLLRAGRPGESRYRWTGRIHEVGLAGMRIELDEDLPAGTPLEVRGLLPGSTHVMFRALCRTVRLSEREQAQSGAIHTSLMIDRFADPADRRRLQQYLEAADQSWAA